jgi:hypothetical protein
MFSFRDQRRSGKKKGRSRSRHRIPLRHDQPALGLENLEARILLAATPTTISLAASVATVGYGQSVTLTATVSGSPTPNEGTVTFTNGATTLGTVSVSSGVAKLVVASLPAGSNVIDAAYSDSSGNYASSMTTAGPGSAIIAIAGVPTSKYLGDGGPATLAILNNPNGVAIDSAGDVFFADTNNDVVREVNQATGVITTVAGTGTAGYSGDHGAATAAELDEPIGLALDSVGDLFIADSLNERIREVNASTGVITTVAGTGTANYTGDGGQATAATLWGPQGIAIDSAGNLYIADDINDVVREVNHASQVITTLAGNGNFGYTGDGGAATAAELGFPEGVAVDTAGNVYIVDNQYNVVREVNHANGLITTIAGNGGTGYTGDGGAATAAELNSPEGVAVDSVGDVFVADENNYAIREVSAGTHDISTVAGPGPVAYDYNGNRILATAADLTTPSWVAVDTVGDLYIADSGNNLIREVNHASQLIATVAGDDFALTYPYSDGGPATESLLSYPADVATDSAGDVFIADTGDNAIREVNHSTGVISTVAGNGTAGFQGDNGPATAAELYAPQGITIDSDGDLFIADTGNHCIREVSSGVITTYAGVGGFGGYSNGVATNSYMGEPQALALDAAGDLFIAESGRRIREVSEVNNVEYLSSPVNTSGTSGYFGDNGDASAAELQVPGGVTVDSAGDIFIADSQNNAIREVRYSTNNIATNTITTVAGNGTAGYTGNGSKATAAELDDPLGIAVDSAGDIFIADTKNHVIREVNAATGVITTIAGGVSGKSGNGGPASAAELESPEGLWLDANGDLFVSDTDGTVREIVAGVVVTDTQIATSVSVSDAGGTYNGSAYPATATVNGSSSLAGVTPTLSYYSGTSATGTALSGAPTTAGAYTALASFAGSTDYASGTASTTFTIGKAAPSVSVTDNSGTYNSAAFAATDAVAGVGSQSAPAGSLEGVTPSLTYYSGTSATGTALSGAPSAAGTYTVLASFAGSTDYTSGAASTSFTINNKPTPTVMVADNGGIYNTTPFAATAEVNGNPSLEGVSPNLSYYAGTSATGTALSGAPTTAGTYTVLASFAGSTDYANGTASTTFTINKAAPTLSVSDNSGTYTGAAFSATDKIAGVGSQSTASPSLEGVTPSLNYFSGTIATGTALSGAPTTAGTYTVLASFTGSADYTTGTGSITFTISKAPPSVSVTDGGGTYTDSAFPATTASLEGVTPTLNYYSGTSATGMALSGAPTNAGTYTVLASFAGSMDYASGTGSTNFTINKAAPTLSVSDYSGTYTGSAFNATDTVAGVGGQSTPAASLEGVTASLTYYSGTLATGTSLIGAPTAVGTYTVLARFAGSSDYNSATASTTFTISNSGKTAPTVTVTDPGGVYTGAPYGATDTVNGGTSLEGVTPTLTYYSGTSATGVVLGGAPTTAGTYTVLANFAGSTDYTTGAASTTFTISKAMPTVTASDQGGTYTGSAFPATTASLEGVTPSLTYYTGTSATGTALSGAPTAVGTYTVLASFAGSTDYTSGTASTTFVIGTANTLVVTNSSNSGAGSLRQAILTANADAVNGNSDTITFASSLNGQTITLTTGTLVLGAAGSGSGTITINGGNQISISGASSNRVFIVDAGVQATLTGLTIEDGNAPGAAGIWNQGTLTISACTFSANVARLINTTSYNGGAIDNGGTITIANSTFSGNSAAGWGGAIDNYSGVMTVTSSTISGNTAGTGGGIGAIGGTVTVSDCTISGNSAVNGGGVDEVNGTTLNLFDTIVAGNTASSTGPDIDGAVASGSNNLVGIGTTALTGITNTNGNQIGTTASPINPLLGPLTNNGGDTQTMTLLVGSPALDAGGALTTLTNTINATGTSFPLSDFANSSAIASTPGSYVIEIDSEQILITIGANGNFSAQRGYNGTTAASHNANAGVYLVTDQIGQNRIGHNDMGAYEDQVRPIQVTTTSDPAVPEPGDGSLREAIMQANEDAAIGFSAAITFNLPDTGQQASITLAAPLELGAGGVGSGTITINGYDSAPAPNVIINAAGTARAFQVDASESAALIDLEITTGNAGSSVGAGILNYGSLTLTDSQISPASGVTGVAAEEGGGIYNAANATLTMSNCYLAGNSASFDGGGVANYGTFTMTSSAVYQNVVSGGVGRFGGGIANFGVMTVDASFVGSNAANNQSSGGGIMNYGGTMTLTNSTVYDNSAVDGGGLRNYDSGILVISDSTICTNTVTGIGGGIYDDAGSSLTLLSSIVSDNTNPSDNDDVNGTASGSYNLIGNGAGMTGLTNGVGGNIVESRLHGTDPNLEDLTSQVYVFAASAGKLSWGEPTPTVELGASSPAIGGGGFLATLVSAIGPSDTVIAVSNAAAIASTPGNYVITIDGEQMQVTGVNLANNTLTVQRGYGTPAASHGAGAGLMLAVDQKGMPRSTTDIGASEHGADITPYGFTPAQLKTAYDLGPQYTGAGETIAVIDGWGQDPTIEPDLYTFSKTFGLTLPVPGANFSIPGVNFVEDNLAGSAAPSDTLEPSLDVEAVHAMAPDAKIVVIDAAQTGPAGFFAAAQVAVNTYHADVVSMSTSFSTAELSDETAFDSDFQGANTIFVASTGDWTYPGYPSVSPNVVAVGGTDLYVDSNGDYLGETAWNGTNSWTSGGGVSTTELQPSYQSGNLTQIGYRSVPDVSLDAATGMKIYDSSPNGSGGPVYDWTEGSGTSFAAPAWAGIIALADQARGTNSQMSSQTALSMLYSLPSTDFHDIVTGGNGVENAGPGYDLVTGLGSPNVNLVVNGLALGQVNQSPTIAGPAIVSNVYGQALAFNSGNTLSIADPNSSSFEWLTVTLTGSGLLSVSTSGGATQTTTSTPTNLTIYGTLAQVNAALATLSYSTTATSGTATLVVTTNDGAAVSTPLNVAINIGKQTAGVSVSDGGGIYKGTAYAASATVNGAASLEGVTLALFYYSGTSATGTALNGAPTAAGTYTVLASFAGSTEYASGAGSATFTIGKATPTVSMTENGGVYNSFGFSATDTVAGVGSQSTPAASLEGVTPSLTVYSGTSASGTALSGPPTTAGTYTVLASFAGSADYTQSIDIAVFTISKAAPTVSMADNGGVYNSLAFSATDTVAGVGSQSSAASSLEGVSPELIYFSGTNATGPSLNGTPTTAGTYTVLASFAGSADYTTGTGSTTFTISKASPSVTVTDNSGTYNGAAFAASATVAGVGSQSSPAASLEGASPDLTYYSGTNATGTALSGDPTAVGTYAVLASFAGSTDYTPGTASATFTIGASTNPPSSSVAALAPRTSLTSFTISWSGTSSSGAPIASYDISVSIDGGAFQPVPGSPFPATTTSTNYTATIGHTYSFISQAIDAAGDVEPAHATADTTITTTATPWQNPGNPLNVLGTGLAIVPEDALAVINYLNTHTAAADVLQPTFSAGSYYYDVDGTGTVIPDDALKIIDYLNNHAAPAVSPAISPAVTPTVAPAVTSSTTGVDSVSSAATDSSSNPSSLTLAPSPLSAEFSLPLPAQSGVAAISPAAVASGQVSGPVNNGAASSFLASAPVGTAPIESSRSLKPLAASASQSAISRTQAGAVDSLLSDPSWNWLDE